MQRPKFKSKEKKEGEAQDTAAIEKGTPNNNNTKAAQQQAQSTTSGWFIREPPTISTLARVFWIVVLAVLLYYLLGRKYDRLQKFREDQRKKLENLAQTELHANNLDQSGESVSTATTTATEEPLDSTTETTATPTTGTPEPTDTASATANVVEPIPAVAKEEPKEKILEEIVNSRQAQLAQRREAVKQAFLDAFHAYRRAGFGSDELRPVSNLPKDTFGGLGATIVDSLDTMYLMGLKEEFEMSKKFVENDLKFDKDTDISVFEVTIRIMGGLLSAYELSKEPIFLERAKELADKLIPAFGTPNGLPFTLINLATGEGKHPTWHRHYSILSEVGSIQLEFRYLANAVNDTKYSQYVDRVMDVLDSLTKPLDGLYPAYIRTDDGRFHGDFVTFGALGDSFYEILLKQYVFTNKTEDRYLRMFKETMYGMQKNLVRQSKPSGYFFIAEHRDGQPAGKQDHLVCFLPGTIALSIIELNNTNTVLQQDQIDVRTGEKIDDLQLAKELMETCYLTYSKQITGIGPEIAAFNLHDPQAADFYNQAGHYLLRPETIESLFMLYRLTGDEKYQERGWRIFENIVKYCRTEQGGYSGIKEVNVSNPEHNDVQESFFLSETLKYLYLLFSDTSVVPLKDYVLTTEGHVLKKIAK